MIVFITSLIQAIVFFLILLVLFIGLSKLAHCLSGLPRSARGPWRNTRGNHNARKE